jgi:hypothetical protein
MPLQARDFQNGGVPMTLRVQESDLARIVAALAIMQAIYSESGCPDEARRTRLLIERIGRTVQ